MVRWVPKGALWHLTPLGTFWSRETNPRSRKEGIRYNKQLLCFAQFPGTSEAGLWDFSHPRGMGRGADQHLPREEPGRWRRRR